MSKMNWVEGKPFTLRERGDQIALRATPEILDTYLDMIIADKDTDTVLFLGDNVDDGDYVSHAEFIERLERLKSAGKKVYLTYATHDYCGAGDDENNFHLARAYTEDKVEYIPFMRKHELFDYYFDYGARQALSVHRESGSYSVMLGDKARLVMIIDNGNGRSHCGLFEDGMRWLEGQLSEAEENGEYELIAVHHPILPPFEIYRQLGEHELYGGYRKMTELLLKYNVRAVFTGHTHIQSIKKYEGENCRFFYDISTSALANSGGKMRKVTLNTESGLCTVESIIADSIKGLDSGALSSYEYMYSLNFPGIWESLLPLGAKDINAFLSEAEGYLPVDKLQKHRALLQLLLRRADNTTLSRAAKLGRVWKELTPKEKDRAKSTPLKEVMFVLLRHFYTGNAPYTPDTPEYRIINGVLKRADRLINTFNIKKFKSIIPPDSSLSESADELLYNNRTGDDDGICFSLK